MKTIPIATGFAALASLLAFAGCDLQQAQTLALRNELQAKEKTIDDLNKRLEELEKANSDIGVQAAKAQDPEKLAEAVAKKVAENNAPLFAEMKKNIDALSQSRPAAAGPSIAAEPGTQSGNPGRMPAQNPPKMVNPGGNSGATKLKMGWQ